ncbi:uncharacterized protein LOC113296364 [Papaver somniferum]|uniref:uncharacterized protein LOC113296364 n=1 Tax=Papaver somniferum TaxID=3469 RepID=UPI000E6FB047|nr:uncharacterized protein LOC113296364 [Papaver somniferum]
MVGASVEKEDDRVSQSVSELETQIRVVNKETSEVVGATVEEDNARTDSINAGHAGQSVVDLINLKNTPTDVIDANQLEKELAKSAAELREAQMKFIHCKNTIAAQKDIALRKNKEDMAAQSFSKDEWTEIVHKPTIQVWQAKSAKTNEGEEKSLNLENKEDNMVGASVEKEDDRVSQSVSELETQIRVVNKETSEVVGATVEEDNARTDSINAGHAGQSVVDLINLKNTPTDVIDANQLEKELAKSAAELREAQMKFIHCKNTIAAQKDIALRKNKEDMAAQSFSKDEWTEIVHKPTIQVWQAKSAKTNEGEEKSLNLENKEDNMVGASVEKEDDRVSQSGINQISTAQSVSELETQIRVVNKETSEVVGATVEEDNARTDSINAGHAGQSVVDLINLKNTPTDVIDANQLEKELAKSAAELREAQMKFIHCKNTIAAQKDIALRKNKEDMAAQSFSKDEWTEIVHKPTIQVWQAKSAKTNEGEEKSLNLENKEDNMVGASVEKEDDRVSQSGINQISTAQSVSELETQIRVVNKETSEVVGATVEEDNARTDSINAGHAGQSVVDLINLKNTPTDVIDANQLEKELAKSAAELREAQMKFIHCKNTIAAQKDIALRKNKEDMAAQSFSKDEWTESDSYSVIEAFKSTNIALFAKQRRVKFLQPTECFWEPPEENEIQLCCDGAARGNPGVAGAGVVARNARCLVLGAMSIGLGVTTNYLAEFYGILVGMEWAVRWGVR